MENLLTGNEGLDIETLCEGLMTLHQNIQKLNQKDRSGSKHILIVDDDEAVRDVLCSFLEKRGFTTAAVRDGKSAISFAATHVLDLIFLDIKMPGLDGIETCKKLMLKRRKELALKLFPNTGIIIMTGYEFQEKENDPYLTGAIDVIRKPFDLKDVYLRVKTWFDLESIE
ncbi:MAG TPA: response regulator, partial [Nitrospirae bacterium]|nr:response regulator [Nitrospirota bacterium]